MRWLLVVAVFAACTKPNPNRCCVDEADCRAKDIPVGSVCDPGLLCRGNQCIAEPCTDNTHCDPAAPFCVDETCAEACTSDDQCPGFGQTGLPRCVDGACVQCRDGLDCTADAPVCEAGVCRGCQANNECASDLCDLDAGSCIEESSILYVSVTGSATAACTKQDPCTLAHAFEVVDTSKRNIKVAAGSYDTSVVLGRSANIYGEPGSFVSTAYLEAGASYKLRDLSFGDLTCTSSTSTAPLALLDGQRLTISGLNLQRCKASVREIHVERNLDYCAIQLSGAAGFEGSELTMTRSEISGGQCAILLDDASKFTISNTLFRDQGNLGAILIYDDNPLPSSISFSTFYNSPWNCSDGTVIFSSNSNLFLNESAGAPANTVTGTRCVHNYAIIKPQANAPSGANNILGADPKFVSAAGGNFYLMAGSPAIDAADPAATESIDFLGTARPQGAQRDVGAFEYKP